MHHSKNDFKHGNLDLSQADLVRIRVRKEDSAFVYAVFEVQAGVLAYSTLDHQPGDRFRDLELVIPVGMRSEAQVILESLKIELKGQLYVEGIDYQS
jgi:hypothetical protein